LSKCGESKVELVDFRDATGGAGHA